MSIEYPHLKDKACIVIMGRAGSGKDTLAKEIKATTDYHYQYQDLKFSETLKLICGDIFGWDLSRMDEQAYKEENLNEVYWGPDFRRIGTRRSMLQFLGTDVFRKINENVWVDAALRNANLLVELSDWSEFDPIFISTDCRFPNERDALQKAFGKTLFIKLHRTDEKKGDAGHSSETSIDDLKCDMEFHIAPGDMKRFEVIASNIICGGWFN